MSETSTTPGPSSRPETSQSPAPNPPPNRPSQQRYAGDGLDFRRPIMSSPPGMGSVIDLTNEPDSSPRRRADIVDLEEDEGEGENEDEEDIVILNHTGPPSSPEVEFVGSTTRPPNPTPLHPPLHPPPQPPLPPAFETYTGFGSSHLWQWLRGHPRFTGSAFPGGLAFGRQLPWPTRIFGPPPQEDTLFIGDDADGGVDLTVDLDVDLNPSGPRPEQRAPVDTYKPPSPPPEGFTRNAGEDDVVVCPNCDEELGMGDEIKQQIWAVKNCGHVRITIFPMVLSVIADSFIPGILW